MLSPSAWARLRASVQAHEGLRLRPYTDTTGHVTIGYGRNLTTVGLRPGEATLLCDNDLREAVDLVRTHHPWAASLSDARLAVLVELMFNLGPDRLALFVPTLALLEAGQWDRAADRLRRTKWATQVKARRADHLLGQLVSGEWWGP